MYAVDKFLRRNQKELQNNLFFKLFSQIYLTKTIRRVASATVNEFFKFDKILHAFKKIISRDMRLLYTTKEFLRY